MGVFPGLANAQRASPGPPRDLPVTADGCLDGDFVVMHGVMDFGADSFSSFFTKVIFGYKDIFTA